MGIVNYVVRPVRRILGDLIRPTEKSPPRLPEEVVKENTKEAFEFFYAHDDFINNQYLDRSRLEFYELLAGECRAIMSTTYAGAGTVKVVDIGCGTGHMLEALSRTLASTYDVQLFGLDFADSAIKKAKSLLPTASFVTDDIYDNELPSDHFDLVLILETLEHLRSPEKAILEAMRICRPKGNVVLTVPNGEKDSWDGHINFWTPSQFKELLSPYGTVDVRFLQNEEVLIASIIK